MKLVLSVMFALPLMAFGGIPEVPGAGSPGGKLHVVMDVDRDSSIKPGWQDGSYPMIEITEKATGKALTSIEYFGSPGDDTRPLREHVQVKWRPDAKAFAITIEDRFYSHTKVFAMNDASQFIEVRFPGYEAMTGYPAPEGAQLRPRGRSTAEGWDGKGRLIYHIFYSPLPTYSGKDPLEHTILLDVSATKMVPVRADPPKPAAPPSSAVEAVAAFRAIWKETLAKKLAESPHLVQLRHQIDEKDKVSARQLSSDHCLKRVTSTLSAAEKKRLIVYGSLDDLKPDRKVWAVTNPGDFGNGFEAYLDQKTGKLLFLWIVPEG